MSIRRHRSKDVTRAVLVAVFGGWLLLARADLKAGPWRCPEPQVEACFKHHGRLSSQNGIPYTIWLIGTTRRVGLVNVDALPAGIQRYLVITSEDYSYVYGDFDLCPVEPDTPGHVRQVCVAGAEKLVVASLTGRRAPFKVLSTWPGAQSDSKQLPR